MHLLRHTSGSLVYRRTADVKLAQEWLGHSSSRITMDTYVHLMKDAQKQTAQAVFTRPAAVPPEQQNWTQGEGAIRVNADLGRLFLSCTLESILSQWKTRRSRGNSPPFRLRLGSLGTKAPILVSHWAVSSAG